LTSLQKSHTAAQSGRHGNRLKRALSPAIGGGDDQVSQKKKRKKLDIEVQQSTTRISEFGGSVTAVWVIARSVLLTLSNVKSKCKYNVIR